MKKTSAYLQSLGITSPRVLIDEGRARTNIRAMAAKARRSEVSLRPHFKTHQSGRVGSWFADEGVDRITVSSVPMAEQFAELGWTDITIAFLLNPLEIPRIEILAAYLARRGGRLGLTLDSVSAAASVPDQLPVHLWLKIDTGYGRTGLAWDNPEAIQAVLEALGHSERVQGLLTHGGHSYLVRGGRGLPALYDESVGRLVATRRNLNRDHLKLSVGDTPCCSAVESFGPVDEVRPGNFVYYDLMQLQIGACGAEQLAAAAVCPVVGLYPERRQIVVHGGAVHLSKEALEEATGRRIYGHLGTLTGPGTGRVIDAAPLTSLSQEHGVIESINSLAADLKIGDLVLVWPVHSCLMCDLHRDPVFI